MTTNLIFRSSKTNLVGSSREDVIRKNIRTILILKYSGLKNHEG